MVVAFPVTQARLAEIRRGSLFHVSAASARDKIIKRALPGDGANCEVDLMGMQGWSVAPFRLLRDYSVLDPHVGELSTWGQYTYFFHGPPSTWAVKKNLGVTKSWGELGPDVTVYKISGSDLADRVRLIFYRPDDSVVVIRGGYSGPAFADPAP